MRVEGVNEVGATDREGSGAEDVVPQKRVKGVDCVFGVEMRGVVSMISRCREYKVCVKEDVGSTGPRPRCVVLSRGVEKARSEELGGGSRVP